MATAMAIAAAKVLTAFAHIPRTETQVKKIVSDVPPHTNQNIGIG